MKRLRNIFSDLLDDRVGMPEPQRRDICWCYECLKDVVDSNGWPVAVQRMILCPTCGNKRCPRATDHKMFCTGSNDPGQPGSRY